MAVIQNLILLDFEMNLTDASNRHVFSNNGVSFSRESRVGSNSAYFNGKSYLSAPDNRGDFALGSTPTGMNYSPDGYAASNPNNNFTIDCWVKPESGGARYYPICSSYQQFYINGGYRIGWAFQLDTTTGKLQMVGYCGGDWYGNLMESTFTVPMDVWSHVAIMSWLLPPGSLASSAKTMYLNGQPDFGGSNYTSPTMTWGNTMWLPQLSAISMAPFYIGLGPRTSFTTPGFSGTFDTDLNYCYAFRGCIDSFRLCAGPRYPVTDTATGLIPPFTPSGNTTTTTATTQTTASTTQPPAVIGQDLCICKFSQQLRDDTNRHTLLNHGTVLSTQSGSGLTSISLISPEI